MLNNNEELITSSIKQQQQSPLNRSCLANRIFNESDWQYFPRLFLHLNLLYIFLTKNLINSASGGVSNIHQNYQSDLLDSLDHNVNQNILNYQQNDFSSSNNLLNNPANNFRIYNSNPNLQANASRDLYDSRQDLNQPAGAYHLDQQQQYYQQQPYVQYQQAQNPTLFQENLPQRLPGMPHKSYSF